jgi:hypothetical protein
MKIKFVNLLQNLNMKDKVKSHNKQYSPLNLVVIVLTICIVAMLLYIIYSYMVKYMRLDIDKFENVQYGHLEHLKIYHYDDKIRLGSSIDGGYVIAKLPDDLNNYDCYISAGVSDEESFSRDFINKYNMKKANCYAFDGTINDYPYSFTKEITYLKKNIGAHNDDKHTNLDFIFNKYNNIFVKMDIEGGEYPWLLNLTDDQLNKIKQMTIEFHGINNSTYNTSQSDKIKCFEKLANTHYPIHIHGNNCGGLTTVNNNQVPDVVEVTYIKKNLLQNPTENKNKLPIPNLDNGNNGNPDYNLSFPPFTY